MLHTWVWRKDRSVLSFKLRLLLSGCIMWSHTKQQNVVISNTCIYLVYQVIHWAIINIWVIYWEYHYLTLKFSTWHSYLLPFRRPCSHMLCRIKLYNMFYCNIFCILFDIKTQCIFYVFLCLGFSVWDAGYMHAQVGVALVLVRMECD